MLEVGISEYFSSRFIWPTVQSFRGWGSFCVEIPSKIMIFIWVKDLSVCISLVTNLSLFVARGGYQSKGWVHVEPTCVPFWAVSAPYFATPLVTTWGHLKAEGSVIPPSPFFSPAPENVASQSFLSVLHTENVPSAPVTSWKGIVVNCRSLWIETKVCKLDSTLLLSAQAQDTTCSIYVFRWWCSYLSG